VLQRFHAPPRLLATAAELLEQQAASSQASHLLMALWTFAGAGGQLRPSQWRSLEPAVGAAMGSARPWMLSKVCWALDKLALPLGVEGERHFWDVSLQHIEALVAHHQENLQRSIQYHQQRAGRRDGQAGGHQQQEQQDRAPGQQGQQQGQQQHHQQQQQQQQQQQGQVHEQHLSYLRMRMADRPQLLKPQHLAQYLQLARASPQHRPPAAWLRAAAGAVDAFLEARFMTSEALVSILVSFSYVQQASVAAAAAQGLVAPLGGSSNGSVRGYAEDAEGLDLGEWARGVLTSSQPYLGKISSPKLMASLLAAASHLNARPSSGWMEAWCEASTPLLQSMCLQQLASAMQTLSTWGHTPAQPWLRAFYVATAQKLGGDAGGQWAEHEPAAAAQEERAGLVPLAAAAAAAAGDAGAQDLGAPVAGPAAAAAAAAAWELAAAEALLDAAVEEEGEEGLLLEAAGLLEPLPAPPAAAAAASGASPDEVKPICKMLRAVAMLGLQPPTSWGLHLALQLRPVLHQLPPAQLAVALKSAATLQLPLDGSWGDALQQALVQHMQHALAAGPGDGAKAAKPAAAAPPAPATPALPASSNRAAAAPPATPSAQLKQQQRQRQPAQEPSKPAPSGPAAAAAAAARPSQQHQASEAEATPQVRLRRKGHQLRLRFFGRLLPAPRGPQRPSPPQPLLQRHPAAAPGGGQAQEPPHLELRQLTLPEQLQQLQQLQGQGQSALPLSPRPRRGSAAAHAAAAAGAALQAVHVADIAWAVGKLGLRLRQPLWDALVRFTLEQRRYQRCAPVALTHMLWGLTKARAHVEPAAMQLLCSYLAASMQSLDAQALVTLAYTLVELRFPPDQPFQEALLARSEQLMGGFGPQGLSNLLYALSMQKVALPQPWLAAYTEAAADCMSGMSTMALTQQVRAAGGLPGCRAAQRAAGLSAPPQPPSSCCCCAAAPQPLARPLLLRASPGPWPLVLLESFCTRAPQIMWGLGKQQASPSSRFMDALAATLPARLPEISVVGACNSIWALSCFGLPPPRQLLVPLADRLLELLPDADHPDADQSPLAVAVWSISVSACEHGGESRVLSRVPPEHLCGAAPLAACPLPLTEPRHLAG
jgi:hypothetical protein